MPSRWVAAVATVTLLAFVVRVLRLDYVNFHSDEAFFIQIAYQGSFMGSLAFNEPHPPLFLALLQAWMGPAGISPFAIRLLPVLYGTALTPLAYQLGRLVGSRRLGLAAAFVVAANPVFIFYAKEVRNNGLMAVTGALSFVLLLLALRRPRLLPAYLAAALAALFSHYYDVAIVALELAIGVAWLARRRKLRLWPWGVIPLALAAGFGPWLAYAHSTLANYDAGHGSPAVFWQNLAQTAQAFTFGFSVRPEDLVGLSVVAAALAVLGVVGLAAIRRGALGVAAAYGLTPVAFGALTLLHQTNFNPRYLFAGAPAYALLLGGALVLLWRWHWLAAAAAGAFLLTLTGYTVRNTDFDPAFQPNGYPDMVAYLGRHAVAGEAMVLDGVSQWPLYYYYGQLRAGLPQRVEFLPEETPAATASTISDLLASGGVWYLETDLLRYDPNHDVERLLAANGYQAADRHFGGQRLEYFAGSQAGSDLATGLPGAATAPASTTAAAGVSAAVGRGSASGVALPGMRLAGSAARRGSVSAGRPLGVVLDWERTEGSVTPFKLSLRLEGAEGTVAQYDSLPLGGYADFAGWAGGQTLRQRAGLFVPVGTTPGEYMLRALAYDARSGQAIGPAVELGAVQVDHAAPQIPAAAELPPVNAQDGEQRLEEAGVPGGGVTPGDRLPVTLIWSGGPTLQPRHVTLAAGGARLDHLAGGDGYPTTAWQAHDVVRDIVTLRVPPSAAPGDEPVTVDGIHIGTIRVLPVVRSFSPPPLAHEVQASFGTVAKLLGYNSQVDAGELHVQIAWQALSDGEASYSAFVHVLDAQGGVAAQVDRPAGTDRWVKGQVVTATYELPSPPAGSSLEVGLYDPITGKRLPVAGGADSVIL